MGNGGLPPTHTHTLSQAPNPLWTLLIPGPLFWNLKMPLALSNLLTLLSRRGVCKNSDRILDSSLGLPTSPAQGAAEAVLGHLCRTLSSNFLGLGATEEVRGCSSGCGGGSRWLCEGPPGWEHASSSAPPYFPWAKGYFYHFQQRMGPKHQQAVSFKSALHKRLTFGAPSGPVSLQTLRILTTSFPSAPCKLS